MDNHLENNRAGDRIQGFSVKTGPKIKSLSHHSFELASPLRTILKALSFPSLSRSHAPLPLLVGHETGCLQRLQIPDEPD
jgi:hypothetical protein